VSDGDHADRGQSPVVRIDADLRATLIASAPDQLCQCDSLLCFLAATRTTACALSVCDDCGDYMTPHFVNYPTVLVRLSRIRTDALKELLGLAWSFAQLKPVKRAARKQKATRGGRSKPV
jgi:hypothetical protein